MEIYDFGLRLKELREQKHMSQTDLANRLNLSRSQISAYEHNTSYPSVEKLIEMAVLFNTSADYILGINNRPCIYLDELTPSQQCTVNKIIELIKAELNSNDR